MGGTLMVFIANHLCDRGTVVNFRKETRWMYYHYTNLITW